MCSAIKLMGDWVFSLIWMFCGVFTLADYVPVMPGSGDLPVVDKQPDLSVTIDAADARQTISDFGASDCWAIQYIGQWPESKKNRIADYLFSTELDSAHNPKGIGLSLWRFNLGVGSQRNNGIHMKWRRSDTFLNETYDGYNWSALPGQRWFLRAAKDRGVEKFLMFAISPPINMTRNGLAYGDPTVGSTNLDLSKKDDFARYMVDTLKHFRDVEGFDFETISPLNEPQWDWNGKSQEGCRYDNSDIKQLVNSLYAELQRQGVHTQIMIAEAGAIDYLNAGDSTNGRQIEQFFNTSSENYIGDKLAPVISAHSYWSDTPNRGLVKKRRALKKKLEAYPGLAYAQTEFCILGKIEGEDELVGSGRDLGIKPALRLARTIHYDLTLLDAVSWQWWLGVSPHNYKDGLVYVDKQEKGETAEIYESRMLWAMGNFSRFIRPGTKRVRLKRSDNAGPEDHVYGLMVSSYHDERNQKIVAVFVNGANEKKAVELKVVNLSAGKKVDFWLPYVTSSNDSLRPYRLVPNGKTINIPSQSIVTFVGGY